MSFKKQQYIFDKFYCYIVVRIQFYCSTVVRIQMTKIHITLNKVYLHIYKPVYIYYYFIL